ncbi:hypothetical protein B0G66_102594 [Bacillus badius]|nr:hypothetical protein B0G66_102594 [Bacillus badius]
MIRLFPIKVGTALFFYKAGEESGTALFNYLEKLWINPRAYRDNRPCAKRFDG